MERYQEYHFLASTPLQYEMVKERFLDTFEGIRKRVKEGRWETVGGMWVEADCVDTRVVWLPDSFGFTWALPTPMAAAARQATTTAYTGSAPVHTFYRASGEAPGLAFRARPPAGDSLGVWLGRRRRWTKHATTSSNSKRASRGAPVYHAAELYAACARRLLGTDYPRAALDEGWARIRRARSLQPFTVSVRGLRGGDS